jgi:chemotaxis protein methyltransferase CheR
MWNSSEPVSPVSRDSRSNPEFVEKKIDRSTLRSSKEFLSSKDFQRLSDLIGREVGIKLPPQKKVMLESRLQRRVKALDMANFREYCEYVFSPNGMARELLQLIDVVTTNTTEFCREPQHFAFLVRHVLPEWSARSSGSARRFTCWSAACSSGEEPYTLAMTLANELGNSSAEYMVLASDVSLTVLEKAARGVYPEERIRSLSPEFKKRYLMKSKDRSRHLVRIAPEIRDRVTFFHLNFMDTDWPVKEKLDVVFCRNVLIYFERQTQQMIIERLCRHIKPGGYLFIGHSESLAGMDLPVRHVAPTIYQRF